MIDQHEEQWLQTVITSLKGRSAEAKQALLKAVLDGLHIENPAGLTTFF